MILLRAKKLKKLGLEINPNKCELKSETENDSIFGKENNLDLTIYLNLIQWKEIQLQFSIQTWLLWNNNQTN